MALLEAQSAVQLDNANDISAALDAYGRAVNLLGKVMEASSSADEQDRLRTIVGPQCLFFNDAKPIHFFF